MLEIQQFQFGFGKKGAKICIKYRKHGSSSFSFSFNCVCFSLFLIYNYSSKIIFIFFSALYILCNLLVRILFFKKSKTFFEPEKLKNHPQKQHTLASVLPKLVRSAQTVIENSHSFINVSQIQIFATKQCYIPGISNDLTVMSCFQFGNVF